MSDTFTALYADGWDDAVVNPMTSADAAARDTAGQPYAVLLTDGGRVRAVLHVAWQDAYLGVTVLGDDGRRRALLHLRRLPSGELFLREHRTWPEGEAPEAPRLTVTWSRTGRRENNEEPTGPRGSSRRTFANEQPPRVPATWTDVLELAGLGRKAVVDGSMPGLPVTTAAEPPWQPPRPAQPRDFATLFTPGAEATFGKEPTIMETVPAGSVRLPSGRLVAADPGVFVREQPWYTVTVEPGVYPVTLAAARWVADSHYRRVAAARLEITGHPVVRWEMALQDGQDLLDLGEREYYGFGVDGGTASFADADEWAAVAALDDDDRDAWEDAWITHGLTIRDQLAVSVADGAVVAWSSGWGDGSYPVWIGYDEGGEVACFVADMRL